MVQGNYKNISFQERLMNNDKHLNCLSFECVYPQRSSDPDSLKGNVPVLGYIAINPKELPFFQTESKKYIFGFGKKEQKKYSIRLFPRKFYIIFKMGQACHIEVGDIGNEISASPDKTEDISVSSELKKDTSSDMNGTIGANAGYENNKCSLDVKLGVGASKQNKNSLNCSEDTKSSYKQTEKRLLWRTNLEYNNEIYKGFFVQELNENEYNKDFTLVNHSDNKVLFNINLSQIENFSFDIHAFCAIDFLGHDVHCISPNNKKIDDKSRAKQVVADCLIKKKLKEKKQDKVDLSHYQMSVKFYE